MRRALKIVLKIVLILLTGITTYFGYRRWPLWTPLPVTGALTIFEIVHFPPGVHSQGLAILIVVGIPLAFSYGLYGVGRAVRAIRERARRP